MLDAKKISVYLCSQIMGPIILCYKFIGPHESVYSRRGVVLSTKMLLGGGCVTSRTKNDYISIDSSQLKQTDTSSGCRINFGNFHNSRDAHPPLSYVFVENKSQSEAEYFYVVY